MRAAALQLDVRDDPDVNLERVLAGLARAAGERVELVVLPEMWPTSFTPTVDAAVLAATDAALEAVRAASGEHGLVVCGSAYGHGAERPTNRAHVFDRGRLAGGYDKVHLFSPTAEHLTFAAGELAPPVLDTSAGRIAPLVCYDLRFPEVTRVPFRAGAELLVASAQWPAPRAGHWRALVVGRAVETQCFVVATNRCGRAVVGRRALELDFSGRSLIVAPDGDVLAEGTDAEELVVADLDLARVRELRRAVPVARDERRELYARWIVPDVTGSA